MPGPAPEPEVAKYRLRRAEGWSQEKAAKSVGRSAAWGYKLERADREREKRREQTEGGRPKTYESLSAKARRSLGDFNYFRKAFFARDDTPWANVAAEAAVGWLMDEDQRDLAVFSMPPGAGKTTIIHDLCCWLIAGGGFKDPAKGRAIRIMLGSETKHVAKHLVVRLRQTLERPGFFYDKTKKTYAELSLLEEFGRFMPQKTLGEYSLWRDDQFVVAQVGDLGVYEKEPTVQAASRESGFLGERVDLAVWDDLVTRKNCRSSDIAEELATWFEDEAESRLEPGGVLILVGQRLSNLDLYRNRMDATYTDEDGNSHLLYHRVVFPAHNEASCANGGSLGPGCKQWDGLDKGCLLVANRLSWKDLLKARSKGNYDTVYLQRDANVEDLLVQPAWIYGGTDADGYDAEGCLDHDRTFHEWPDRTGLVDVCCVDPSVTKFWAYEWWAVEPVEPHRAWLIWGQRKKMLSGTDSGFLDYNPRDNRHVGAMEEIQQKSGELGHPIRVWIIEGNAAHKYLGDNHAFRSWQQKWPLVTVIRHQTQGANKLGDELGLRATIPYRYKLGMDRLPYAKGLDVRNYLKAKIEELTKYPDYPTDDTLMANWFMHNRMREVLWKARMMNSTNYNLPSDEEELPAFLEETSYVAS